MSRSLGSLTLDLLLKTGGFVASLDSATGAVKRTSEQMKKAAERLTASLQTPFETATKSIRFYGELLQTTAGFQETYNRAVKKTAQELMAANPAQQQYNKLVADAAKLTAKFGVTAQQTYRNTFKEITRLATAGQITPEVRTAALKEAKTVRDASNASLQESLRLEAEAKRIIEGNRTAQEDYNAAIANLDTLKATLGQAEYNKEVARLKAVLDASNPALIAQNKAFADAARLAAAATTPLERYLADIRAIGAAKIARPDLITRPVQRTLTTQARERFIGSDPNEQAKITATTAAIEAQNRAMEEAKRIAASMQSPLQQYHARLAEIKKAAADFPKIVTPEIETAAIDEARARYNALNGVTEENNRIAAEATRIKQQAISPQQTFNAALDQAEDLLARNEITQAEYNAEIKRAEKVLDATDDELKELNKLEAESKRLKQSLLTPQQQLTAAIREYDKMLKAGFIDQKQMNAAVRQFKADAAGAQAGLKGLNTQLGSRLTRGAATLGAGYFGLQTVKTIINTADEYAKLTNRLRLVTKSTAELTQVQEDLFEIAQRTRTEYAGVAELYTKLALTGTELGASQQDILKFTEAVGNALIISGTSAQTARGALTQLAQGIGGVTFRAEEFNAVLEGVPELLRAMAKHVPEAGGSLIKLREMVQDSSLGSRVALRAIVAGSEELAKRVAELPVTVEGAFTRLRNAFVKATGESANLQPFTDAVNDLATAVSDPGFQASFATFVGLCVKLSTLTFEGLGFLAQLPTAIGEKLGSIVGGSDDPIARLSDELAQLEQRRADLIEGATAVMGKGVKLDLIATRYPELDLLDLKIKAISEHILQWGKDYASANKAGKAAAAQAGELVDPIAIDKEMEKAREAIMSQIKALEQQRDTMGMTAIEVMRYRLTQGDLAETLRKSGLSVSEFTKRFIELTKAIEQGTALEKLKDLNEGLQEQLDAMTEAEILETQGAEAAARYAQTHGDLAKTIREAKGIFDDTGEAAKTYSDTLATVPSALATTVTVDTTQAIEEVQFFYDRVSGKPLTTTLTVAVDTSALDAAQREAERNIALKVEADQRAAIKSAKDLIRELEEQAAATEAVRIAEEHGAVAGLNYRIAHGDLKDLFERLGPLAGEYAEQLRILTEAEEQRARAVEAQAASEQYIPSQTKAANDYALAIEGLTKRLKDNEFGLYGSEEAQRKFNAAVKDADKAYKEAIKSSEDMFSVFRDEAQRASQQALADFFYEPFKSGLDDMVASFADAVRKIAANILAAKLAEKLFEGMEDQFDKAGGWFSGPGGGLGGILDLFKFGKGGATAAVPPAPTAPAGVLDPGLGAAVAPLLPASEVLQTAATTLTTGASTLQETCTAAFAPASTTLQSAAELLMQAAQALQACECVSMGAVAGATAPGGVLSEISVTAARIPERGAVGPAGGPVANSLVSTGEETKELARDVFRLAAGLIEPKLAPLLALIDILRAFRAPDLGGMTKWFGALMGGFGAAGGGPIRGPGTGTSDSIPAWVSHGEFIVKAAAVQQPGASAFLDAFNDGRIRMAELRASLDAIKHLPRFSRGGAVPLTRVTPKAFATGGMATARVLDDRRRGPTIVQQLTINSPNGQVSRQTELQVTAAAARGVKVADRRNN